jgi:5-deoxy-5-amino-3-dehydroquinate synthase
VVESYALPTRLPVGIDRGLLIEVMARDKKAVRGLTFVLDGPAGVERVEDVPRDLAVECLEALT